jgi:hypothetical protein
VLPVAPRSTVAPRGASNMAQPVGGAVIRTLAHVRDSELRDLAAMEAANLVSLKEYFARRAPPKQPWDC